MNLDATAATPDIPALMRERLAALQPEALEIYDDSAEHIGHAGAQSGGGHYQLLIVSRAFHHQTRLARHRMVYAALGNLLPSKIHALAITAWTPEEFHRTFAR